MREQTEPMVRAQILLTPRQRRRIEHLARSEGRKLAEVTRQAIEIGLNALEGQTDEALRKDLAALAELRRMRHELQEKHGVYQGDPVAEAREEREKQMERVWRDE